MERRRDAATMNSSTTLETRSRSEPAQADQRGMSLAVADVGWFNTENLFREIDRESVAVLLLKCLDYVNGWRRGVYPWSKPAGCGRQAKGRGNGSSFCPAGG